MAGKSRFKLPRNKCRIGVLLVNTGSPDAPTPRAVRRYLAQFLSDRRVIEYPRWIWLPLLYGVILNTRPWRSARLYQRVWGENGSPLLYYTRRLAEALQERLQQESPACVLVRAGMRYGHPSITAALEEFHQIEISKIILLPLFPQYSGTTTGTILDEFFAALRSWRAIPAIQTIASYYDHPAYIQALATRIRDFWGQNGKPEYVLFSFHGIPQSYAEDGDPYPTQCQETARLLAQALALPEGAWSLSFQSRFGAQAWLKPYTDETLAALARRSFSRLDVACPGFAVDCLETLDEIGHEGRRIYIENGGKAFAYLPALNDSPLHVEALAKVLAPALNCRSEILQSARQT